MNSRLRTGFTVVEILIVGVVVAILTVITATIYLNAQVQARDTQMRDAADKVADALSLYLSKNNGQYPKGGYLSTTPIGSGTACVDGANGWFESTAYGANGCTIEDVLVANMYLPQGFSTTLPANTYKGNSTNQSLMLYTMSSGKAVMLYYTLEEPSAADNANFQSEMNRCGDPGIYSNTYQYQNGMRNAICIQY